MNAGHEEKNVKGEEMETMYLTRKQLAARLGLHPSSIGRLVKAGRLPPPVWWGPQAARWPLLEIKEFENKLLAGRPKIPLQPSRPPGRPRLQPLPQSSSH